MTTDCLAGLEAQVAEMKTTLVRIEAEMKSMLVRIEGLLAGPKEPRGGYTVEEVAALLNRNPYTVREWCREGRISASKRQERRGGAELWSISAAEVARYKDEGLLPPDPYRNAPR